MKYCEQTHHKETCDWDSIQILKGKLQEKKNIKIIIWIWEQSLEQEIVE